MSNRTSLGDRMKGYENVSRHFLIRRMPVIIRIDGKAFHTFTKGMKKPFDDILVRTMQKTMKYLCENVQGCVLGYTQSDEITLVLVDYKTLDTCAWFDNNVQKIVSVSASMATLAFNKYFQELVKEDMVYGAVTGDFNNASQYILKINKALFDSRVFNIPKEEVANCLIWRQKDAIRNSIQAVGQANFSFKELQSKNCTQIQDMLMIEKGIDWNDIPTHLQRGSCCIKQQIGEHSSWVIDTEIPIFTQDREYIERLVYL